MWASFYRSNHVVRTKATKIAQIEEFMFPYMIFVHWSAEKDKLMGLTGLISMSFVADTLVYVYF